PHPRHPDRSDRFRGALRRGGDRRHLEIDKQRLGMEGHLRPPARQCVRRAGHLRARSEDRLGRIGRTEQSSELVVGRRRLPHDGGDTWTYLGLHDTRAIGRIVLDPTDANVAYVAAAGNLWAGNEERGVFRTRDAGRTWAKVLYVDQFTGATDIVIDPRDARV